VRHKCPPFAESGAQYLVKYIACVFEVLVFFSLFEVIHQRLDSLALATNMAVSSANVASFQPLAVGLSEMNKLYKVRDKTAP
jgi:hypothetical protein